MARQLKTLTQVSSQSVPAHIEWLTVALPPTTEDSVLSSDFCRHAHHMWYTFTQTLCVWYNTQISVQKLSLRAGEVTQSWCVTYEKSSHSGILCPLSTVEVEARSQELSHSNQISDLQILREACSVKKIGRKQPYPPTYTYTCTFTCQKKKTTHLKVSFVWA